MVFKKTKIKLGIIGLGYVGLPLAIEFGKKIQTVGYDHNQLRIKNLKIKKDITGQISTEDFINSKFLSFSSNDKDLINCNYYIITVPTPVFKNRKPDLRLLKKASITVAKYLNKGDTVIYESTVYPGVTENFCANIIEKYSGLIFNIDFFVGYSPERINPSDKVHTILNITKVVSGSNLDVTNNIFKLYKLILGNKLFKASSIKTAEAAKVIENTQRDLNIALINELAIIFNKLNIDTHDVLEAARTKWNFHDFRPGLVGGHCIGVDPYYLADCSLKAGYNPKIILSGRETNDNMHVHIYNRVKSLIKFKLLSKVNTRILILGFTFKENCPDSRNSKVYDLYKKFKDNKYFIDVYDPIADVKEVYNEYGLNLQKKLKPSFYNVIIFAVAHADFINNYKKYLAFCSSERLIFDIKGVLPKREIDGRL